MKKKLSIFILLTLMVGIGCISLGGCGSNDNSSSSPDSTSQQGPTWEDEIIEDKEHGDVELPEIERP